MGDWHCKQIPNGAAPIVVCERETLLAENERLRKALELSCRDESAESWDLLVLHYLKEARRGD